MYCVDCGNPLNETDNFCVNCCNLINKNSSHNNHQINYFTKHWHGNLSLVKSYWVNNVLLSTILLIIISFLDSRLPFSDNPKSFHLYLAVLWIIGLIYTVWMLVGLWRSATNYISTNRIPFWGYIVKIFVVIGTIQNFYIFTQVGHPQFIEHIEVLINKDSVAGYNLSIDNSETELIITGGIDYGLANDIENYFDQYPNIVILHLNSKGGRIYESEKIAKFIKTKNLITYSSVECFSACVDIFIAGNHRFLKKTAKMGFHQPSFPGLDELDLIDVIASQKQFYSRQGIEKAFIDKAFSISSDQLWKPTNLELLKANVVTKIVD